METPSFHEQMKVAREELRQLGEALAYGPEFIWPVPQGVIDGVRWKWCDNAYKQFKHMWD